MAKKNLSQLAKKPATNTAVAQEKKPVATPVVKVASIPNKDDDKRLTDEERDLKAKLQVASLLSDFDLLTVGKKEEAVVEEEPDLMSEREWFDEQIILLNSTIDQLKDENARLSQGGGNANYNTNGISETNTVENVIALFIEIQNVYDNLKRQGGELIINPIQFLDRMREFFPFLEQYRRQLIGE